MFFVMRMFTRDFFIVFAFRHWGEFRRLGPAVLQKKNDGLGLREFCHFRLLLVW